jgi:hypothetical protein
MSDPTGIATFFTTHAALRAEQLLHEAGIHGQLVPAPRHLSSDCTIALTFPRVEQERVRELLDHNGIEPSGIFQGTP